MQHKIILGVLAAVFCVAAIHNADATSVKKMTVANLIKYGDKIIAGRVTAISDGFDSKNIPYTDITVAVSESLKGNVNGNYTFRQFGLVQPRQINGRTYLGVSPDGFPRFKKNEDVVLFLFKKTSLGFQSSAGLMQGKFTVTGRTLTNDVNNFGLFKDITVNQSQLTPDEKKMLTVESGPLDNELFKGFVRKAVQQNWFN
ncbi:MAG TPA: hypothetical protein VJS69_01160 [Candidatus Krumholzibacteria bacterium]|nr:hypothetical protein [Candidatus Krumholzibacteria bacterium]